MTTTKDTHERSPAVDIFETEDAVTLLADLPGVKPDELRIDLRDSVLTLSGGAFYRQFTLGEKIDQARIDARLSDGVLRLELPKVERYKARQITVRAD